MAHFAVTQDRLPSKRRLSTALDGLSDSAPVVIMLHGYKYDPASIDHNPHDHIFALHPNQGSKRPASWPRRLGLRGHKALAIGFGWQARGTIWAAHARAAAIAPNLARLISRIRQTAPHRPIHVVAHSMGARVALATLASLPTGSVNRIILIAAAAFEHELENALNMPAGQSTEVINIRSRANTVFDLMLRAALPHWGRTVGCGRLERQNLLHIAIDQPQTQTALTDAGYPLLGAGPRICHWSGYLRQDACGLYRALLHRPETTPLPYLQTLLEQRRDHNAVSVAAKSLSFR